MKAYLYALAAVAATFIAHEAGLLSGFYLAFPPYDIFMHMLGGLGIGLFAFALMNSFIPARFHRRWLIILAVFIGGLAWEIMEAHYDIAGYKLWTTPYFIDTTKDLIDDIIGGVVAAVTCIRRSKTV